METKDVKAAVETAKKVGEQALAAGETKTESWLQWLMDRKFTALVTAGIAVGIFFVGYVFHAIVHSCG